MTPMTPFKPIEKTVKALIQIVHPAAEGKVGGDFSYTVDQDFYVYVGQVPGGGSADQTEGSWVVDIEVFGKDWNLVAQRSLDIEAALVSTRGFRHDGQQIDRVFVNISASERPWDADNVYRIGGTYVFTARRQG